MSVYQPLVGLATVKTAAINLLRNPPATGCDAPRLVYYLAEVERQNGLPARTLPVPPGPDSYYPGVDFTSWVQDLLPSIIVAAVPTGDAERHDAGAYGQWFRLQIAAIVQGDDEDSAQETAGYYSAAIAGAILQKGSLGGVATKTNLLNAGLPEFLEDPATRAYARTVTTFNSFIEPIAVESGGPTAFPTDPYTEAAALPIVQTVTTTFTGEPFD